MCWSYYNLALNHWFNSSQISQSWHHNLRRPIKCSVCCYPYSSKHLNHLPPNCTHLILISIIQCWHDHVIFPLTHWGSVTHIYVGELTIIGSDNGLSPVRRQAIIWTNAGILLIGPLGTNFSENLIEILTFSFTKMRLQVSSAKWRPFCLGLNVLNHAVHMGYIQWISNHFQKGHYLIVENIHWKFSLKE